MCKTRDIELRLTLTEYLDGGGCTTVLVVVGPDSRPQLVDVEDWPSWQGLSRELWWATAALVSDWRQSLIEVPECTHESPLGVMPGQEPLW